MTEEEYGRPLSGFETAAFFAADHASVENGKAYVNGGFWDSIFQVSYPAQISVSLVAVLRVPTEADSANHKFTVEMEDAAHNKLPSLKIEGEFRVRAAPTLEPGEPSVLPIAIPLNGLNIERAGVYWFVLSVNGDEIDRFRVRAVQGGLMPMQQLEASNPNSGDATQAE